MNVNRKSEVTMKLDRKRGVEPLVHNTPWCLLPENGADDEGRTHNLLDGNQVLSH